VTREDRAELVSAITEAVIESLDNRQSTCPRPECRYQDLDPEALAQVILFFRNFNEAVSEGRSIFFKTVVALGATGTAAVIGYGLVYLIAKATARLKGL
jgi:hypothetical protein